MKLALQVVVASLAGLAFFALALFVPAGTVNYWQAWVFIAVFTISSAIPTVYPGVKSPDTLRRRMHAGPTAEVRLVQKILMPAITLLVLATLALGAMIMSIGMPPALDSYWGWLAMPLVVPALVARIRDEEVLLAEQLAGYRTYREMVRYRVVPYIW